MDGTIKYYVVFFFWCHCASLHCHLLYNDAGRKHFFCFPSKHLEKGLMGSGDMMREVNSQKLSKDMHSNLSCIGPYM